MVVHPDDIDSARKINAPDSKVSSLAINDDIEGSEEDEERSVAAIKCVVPFASCALVALAQGLTSRGLSSRSFLREQWPEPGWWERPVPTSESSTEATFD